MGSYFAGIQTPSGRYYPFSVWTYGRIEMQFQWLMLRPAFADEEKRRELARRLNEIPGIDIPQDAIARRPAFDVEALADPDRLARFFQVMDWCIAEIEAAERVA